jgi:hypothetical protein
MPDPDKKAPPILDAHGKPVPTAKDAACPQCGAGPDKRGPRGGFGVRRPICHVCAFLWEDEVWDD